MEKAKTKGVNFHLPIDSITADNFDANANTGSAPSDAIPSGWMGLDIGPQSCAETKRLTVTRPVV